MLYNIYQVSDMCITDSIRYISGTYISATNQLYIGHFYISGIRFITLKIHLKIETLISKLLVTNIFLIDIGHRYLYEILIIGGTMCDTNFSISFF